MAWKSEGAQPFDGRSGLVDDDDDDDGEGSKSQAASSQFLDLAPPSTTIRGIARVPSARGSSSVTRVFSCSALDDAMSVRTGLPADSRPPSPQPVWGRSTRDMSGSGGAGGNGLQSFKGFSQVDLTKSFSRSASRSSGFGGERVAAGRRNQGGHSNHRDGERPDLWRDRTAPGHEAHERPTPCSISPSGASPLRQPPPVGFIGGQGSKM